jgi:hypothetical protein
MTATPLLTRTMTPGGQQFAAAGPWTAAHAERLERLVQEASHVDTGAAQVTVDMEGVDELDTAVRGCWSACPAARTSPARRPCSPA